VRDGRRPGRRRRWIGEVGMRCGGMRRDLQAAKHTRGHSCVHVAAAYARNLFEMK
jgi:hypothetical protein